MAHNLTDWSAVKFRLSATIGDIVFHDVVQWSANFELNNIPEATLLVAVGRNVADVNQAATIHHAVTQLNRKLPAVVKLRVLKHDQNPRTQQYWPTDEEIVIFRGSAVDTGWQRSDEHAQFVIHLLHWLEDLNCSSSISATSHPHNPADFTNSAIFSTLGVSHGGSKADPNWKPMCDAQKVITSTTLQKDLWGLILQPWLVTIAGTDRIDINRNSPLGGAGFTPRGNDAALAALARMTPASSGSCAYVPLQLDTSGANGFALANGVRKALERETFGSWVHTTLWGKLVGEWAPSYFFSIAPRIEDARVIPFTGPLRAPAFKQILSEDYSHCHKSAALPQLLQAVGIFHGTMMRAGGNMDPGAYPIRYDRLGGWYAPVDDPSVTERGLILLKEPPGWLTDVIPYTDYSRSATQANGGPKGTTFAPGVGPGLEHVDPATAVQSVAGHGGKDSCAFDRYAHTWYCLEMLKASQAEISGRLRFDIAPGSNVRVDGASERFLQGRDQLAVPIWGSVLRVSMLINAETKQAGTSFTLAHVRTDAENKDDRRSVARPPLYLEAWPGCTLHDAFN